MNVASNNFVQAIAVFAILFVMSQVPSAPDENRSPSKRK
jgi:hypothetical protein